MTAEPFEQLDEEARREDGSGVVKQTLATAAAGAITAGIAGAAKAFRDRQTHESGGNGAEREDDEAASQERPQPEEPRATAQPDAEHDEATPDPAARADQDDGRETDDRAEDREVAAARRRAQELGSAAYYENIHLGELVAERIAHKRALDAERVAARLSPHATDFSRDLGEPSELLAFKGSFLVRRAQSAAFDAALEDLARTEGDRLRFEAIGPLPPAAFATLEGGSAWA